jgi:glycine cleavage system H protein
MRLMAAHCYRPLFVYFVSDIPYDLVEDYHYNTLIGVLSQEVRMSNIPSDLLYTKEDEWVRVDGEEATIGITDYAQDALSDIVYVELPDEGESFAIGDSFGVVESVKAAADLYIPISGEVTGVNEELLDTPEVLNSDPFEGGWMLKIKIAVPGELEGLMDAEAYTAYCDERD